MAVAVYMVFFYAQEGSMGVAQRIFYFHISLSLMTFLAFFLLVSASLVYLIFKRSYWNVVARASAEIGFLFCSLVLLTVPLWTRPVWNVWWTWDMRLALTLILWCLYAGYLLVRQYTDGLREANYAAVFGTMAFSIVSGAYFFIRWWWTRHPVTIMTGKAVTGFTPEMVTTLFVCIATFFCLFIYLIQQRVALGIMYVDLDKIRRSLAEHHIKHHGFLVENENFIIEEYNFQEYTKS
jgi:heme exporter protein C